MKYFDIHTHLNFSAFDSDRDEVIARALDAGVGMINVGTQKDTSKKAIEIAEKYEKGVYAIVGIHPIHTSQSFHDKEEIGGEGFNSRAEDFNLEYYEELARNEKVVAIGETGLDYYHLDEDSEKKQVEIFEHHIELANKLEKPLMLHIRGSKDGSRNAYKDTLDILKSKSKTRGNAHFFAGTMDEANEFLDLGFSISFTAVITRTSDYDELVKFVPLDMIMSETDAPYVPPANHKGKRNEPLYVREVAERIAEIRKEDKDKVLRALVNNAIERFNIKM